MPQNPAVREREADLPRQTVPQSSDDFTNERGAYRTLRLEVVRLRASNQAMSEALDHFIQTAELNEQVTGSMGFLQDAYDQAVEAKASATKTHARR